MDNMNNTENKYEEFSEDTDELIELDKLSNDETLSGSASADICSTSGGFTVKLILPSPRSTHTSSWQG